MDSQEISLMIIENYDNYISDFPDGVRIIAEEKVQEILDAGDEDVAGYFAALKNSGCTSSLAIKYLVAGYLAAIKIAYDDSQ